MPLELRVCPLAADIARRRRRHEHRGRRARRAAEACKGRVLPAPCPFRSLDRICAQPRRIKGLSAAERRWQRTARTSPLACF